MYPDREPSYQSFRDWDDILTNQATLARACNTPILTCFILIDFHSQRWEVLQFLLEIHDAY